MLVGESGLQTERQSPGAGVTAPGGDRWGQESVWKADQDSVSELERAKLGGKCETVALKPDCLVQILALLLTSCETEEKLLPLPVPQLFHL